MYEAPNAIDLVHLACDTCKAPVTVDHYGHYIHVGDKEKYWSLHPNSNERFHVSVNGKNYEWEK